VTPPPPTTEQTKTTFQASLSAHAESFPKAASLPGKHSLQEKQPCRGASIPVATKGSGSSEKLPILGS